MGLSNVNCPVAADIADSEAVCVCLCLVIGKQGVGGGYLIYAVLYSWGDVMVRAPEQ